VLAPLAVNVAVKPAQIVEEFTETDGKGVTETFETAVFVQPLIVPVTVKFVLVVGDTVNGFVVDPVFQV
jgi:hypothetical protein